MDLGRKPGFTRDRGTNAHSGRHEIEEEATIVSDNVEEVGAKSTTRSVIPSINLEKSTGKTKDYLVSPTHYT